LKTQLNSILFAKTLVRKDVASSAPPPSTGPTIDKANSTPEDGPSSGGNAENQSEKEFSSKAQVMTLMTTDVDRVGGLSAHSYLIGA
jgi:hypothetical protein